jgi:hypothetical protein
MHSKSIQIESRNNVHGLALASNALKTYNAKLSSSMYDFTIATRRSGFGAQATEYGELVTIDCHFPIRDLKRLRPVCG